MIEIEIQMKRGRAHVRADIIDGFAVHRQVDGDKWVVTHVPTGAMFPGLFPRWDAAARFARGIKAAAPGIDWEALRCVSEVPSPLQIAVTTFMLECSAIRLRGPKLPRAVRQ